jgi:hypothetical protein
MAHPSPATTRIYQTDGSTIDVIETLAWLTSQIAQPVGVGGMPVTPTVHLADGTAVWVNLRQVTKMQPL